MNEHYKQLTQASRYQIFALRDTGIPMRQIGDQVEVNFSRVRRELRRNSTQTGYDPQSAHQQSNVRKRTAIKANKRKYEWSDPAFLAEEIRHGDANRRRN